MPMKFVANLEDHEITVHIVGFCEALVTEGVPANEADMYRHNEKEAIDVTGEMFTILVCPVCRKKYLHIDNG